MSKSVSVHLCLHHHQPVGNSDGVIEEIYQHCYRPLLEGLSASKAVRFHLSYSGFLLRFLERNHPEYLDRVRSLVEAGRVELLASGFYGPILPDLSNQDLDGQLKLSQGWFLERFGVQPRGVWLTEAVWDKSLIRGFRDRKLDYTIIRDERFFQTGLSRADLHGYWITEELGKTLALFPSSEELYARIPFGSPEDWGRYLRRMANRSRLRLTLGDVAERWGGWPGTREPLYDREGLQRLVDFFDDSSEWLKFQLFSETLRTQPPQGRCYLPDGANSDLGAWSLPDSSRSRFIEARRELERRHDAGRFLPFFRAGCWENFKGRYPESNLMNKKGLWLKRKLESKKVPDPVSQDWLWQAQCNTAYWHGSSGGIYLPHLREAVWSRLLATQRRLELGGKQLKLERQDVDGDGLEELLVFSPEMHIGVSPARGGTLFEWSDLEGLHNYANTLTRQRESGPATDSASEAADPYPRGIFHDHVVARKTTVRQIREGKFMDRADWTRRLFKVVSARRKAGNVEVTLESRGFVEQGGLDQAVRLRKTFVFSDGGKCIDMAASLINEGKSTLEGVYAVEGNLSLGPGQESVWCSVQGKPPERLGEGLYAESVLQADWRDPGDNWNVAVKTDQPMLLWSTDLRTKRPDSIDSGGLCQGHLIWTGWIFRIPTGEEMTFRARWSTRIVHHKKVD